MASRMRGGGTWLANGMVAGAVFGAVGVAALFCVQCVLGDNASYLTGGSASALNLLDNSFFPPAAAGKASRTSSAAYARLPTGRSRRIRESVRRPCATRNRSDDPCF
jgi:hypothetical protein